MSDSTRRAGRLLRPAALAALAAAAARWRRRAPRARPPERRAPAPRRPRRAPAARRRAAPPPRPASALAVTKYTLANGLEVILHEDHSAPVVAVNTYYKVGSGDEQRGRTGFAHLFEHIMFMGSENVPVGAFDQWLEAAGANNNGSTNQDRTNYYEWMPSNALPLALWLEADRMGFLLPTMDQAKLDLQRDVVKNERRERVDNVPYGRAYETVLAALYPAAHPYSWSTIGSMADLSAASLEDVKQFFRTYYAPNNATLVIAGDFRPDSARAQVQRYFGGIPRGPALPARPDPGAGAPRARHGPRARGQGAAAALLLRLPDRALLRARRRGARRARLRARRRQERPAVQAPRLRRAGRAGGGRVAVLGALAGVFNVDVTAKQGQSPARLAATVDEELARVAAAGVTPRELDRAKNTIRARFLDRLATVSGKAELLNLYNYFAGTPDYVRQDAARYDAVTAADVQRAARQYLLQPKVVLTVVPEGRRDLALGAARGAVAPASKVRINVRQDAR
jgi:zinc protease